MFRAILNPFAVSGFVYLALHTAATLAGPAKDFQLNCCNVKNPPEWLNREDVRRVVDRVQDALDWDIRRVNVTFYPNQEGYDAMSKLSFRSAAFTQKSDQSIHIAPVADFATLEPTLGHELVHVIFIQKYKNGIPEWLVEGFANYIGTNRKVDYPWLAKQTFVPVTSLSHPNSGNVDVKLHYQESFAAAAMIADRCRINDLFMLTAGSKMEKYFETFCKIKNIDSSVKEWIQTEGLKSSPRSPVKEPAKKKLP